MMKKRPNDIIVDGFSTDGMTPEELQALMRPQSEAYAKALADQLDEESKERQERIRANRALLEALDDVA